jgi:hypothetical protein
MRKSHEANLSNSGDCIGVDLIRQLGYAGQGAAIAD